MGAAGLVSAGLVSAGLVSAGLVSAGLVSAGLGSACLAAGAMPAHFIKAAYSPRSRPFSALPGSEYCELVMSSVASASCAAPITLLPFCW
ncbi:hypothetical protein F2P45_19340 [Massilia sp. CCM 8733]|uniref:Uncharacterized protein n=1 Tax=Massilia mucilaginosa TaxID=2609282 RepID=A0ABX0NWL9_9BURK|nr:hypothetical protein [Massilia mucilaginosa]